MTGEMTQADYLAELAVLSPRQREVLTLVAKGFSTVEIGPMLRVSLDTIRQYRWEIQHRLGINLYAACALAARAGIA